MGLFSFAVDPVLPSLEPAAPTHPTAPVTIIRTINIRVFISAPA